MDSKKILVIDDNPVVIRLNQSLLEAAGFEVFTAKDGEEGFLRAREERPDVILLDLVLPKMHGFELCQKLKNDPQTGHIPVIIVTGTGLEDVVKNEPSIKADGFLNKPYGPEELTAVVNKAMAAG